MTGDVERIAELEAQVARTGTEDAMTLAELSRQYQCALEYRRRAWSLTTDPDELETIDGRVEQAREALEQGWAEYHAERLIESL